MNYLDPLSASQICYRFNLGEPVTFEQLQRLLHDLYVSAQLNPGYLFVAEYDHGTLTAEIKLNNGYSISHPQFVAREFGFDEIAGLSAYRGIRRLLSHTTGSSIRVVPLPDLERGSVIVGFFR
jgi:hypothetical protein